MMTRRDVVHWLGVLLRLFLLLAALATVLHPVESPYLAFLRRGDTLAEVAERSAAVAAYQRATRYRPQDPVPYERMARVALDWGRLDDARAMAQEAGRLGASEMVIERLFLETYVIEESWERAAEHATKLLASAPADRDARHALARAQICMGEWQAAQASYERLLSSGPADAEAHQGIGELLLGVDPVAIEHLFVADTELARALLDALSEPGAAGDPVYVSMLAGRVLFEREAWCEAVLQFERVVGERPDYGEAQAYLGYALDRAGRVGEGTVHLNKAVELAPESAVVHMLLGLHHDRAGALLAARTEYEAAYDLDRENPAICLEIGETWVAEGRYVAAEIWLREAVALQPDDPALRESLVRFYVEHGTEDQAREAAAELVEQAPDSAIAHDLQGWAAFRSGDRGLAEESLLQALALDQTSALVYYHLGCLWQELGAGERAQQAFTHAFDLDLTGEVGPLIERATGEQRLAGFRLGDD